MIYGNFVEDGVVKNARFRLWNNYDRDESNLPFFYLRKRLKNAGILLNTPDLNKGKDIRFQIHHNIPKRQQDAIGKLFLLQMECESIWPDNFDSVKLRKYQKIMGWSRENREQGIVHLNFPNRLNSGWLARSERKKKYCMIAANKIPSKRVRGISDLYKERAKLVNFVASRPQYASDFSLYGAGWDLNFQNATKFFLKKILKQDFYCWADLRAGINKFFFYKGIAATKNQILAEHDFAFCFENFGGFSGYVTEKIFDCFSNGCIPIYKGDDSVRECIPDNCYIDASQFNDFEELFCFLESISVAEIIEYRSRIHDLIASQRLRKYSLQSFVDTIVNTITVELSHC